VSPPFDVVPSRPVARSVTTHRLRVELPEIAGDARLAAGVHLALAALPGIQGASVNPLTGRALLVFGGTRWTGDGSRAQLLDDAHLWSP